MYLLYFLICYASTLLTSVNSYVLLAANLDDFRSIAKKFVPEKLADQIVEMASGSGIKYREPSFNHNNEETEFSEIDSRQDRMDHSYEITTESYKPIRVVTQQSSERPRFEMKSESGLSLDEIVEKVKLRLQTELLNREGREQAQLRPVPHPPMRLTAGNEPEPLPVYDYKNPAEVEKEVPQYEDVGLEKPRAKPFAPVQYQGQMIQRQPLIQLQQKKLTVDRNKNLLPKQNRYVGRQAVPTPVSTGKKIRYVQQVQRVPVSTKPNIKKQPRLQQSAMQQQRQQLNRLAQKQKIVRNKQLIRVTPQSVVQALPTTKQQEETEPDIGIFEAVDMLKSNDSYEDYVIPAKEEVFESDVPEETVTYASIVVPLTRKVTKRTTPVPSMPDEEPMAEEIIDPNGAQVAAEAVEYYYDAPESTTEPKAKTESISYEEKETKPDPNATTVAEILVKGKTTKKTKMGTMIPTREFYKLSSPNYYAKLPTIAEKYNFNEPIPEQDREPENLKPIGNPPASINGKVMLL